jgi:nucleoside-diphosphate-sugar epimerase
MVRNVLVIGGAGYIGSVLVHKLLVKNHKVKVLDYLLYDNYTSISALRKHPGFTFIHGDFTNFDKIGNTLEDVTDIVLLAALVGDPISKKYPELALKYNEWGPINFISNLNSYQIDKFIFLSTCSNYGLRIDDTPADENAELNPQSVYAKNKVAVENYIMSNKEKYSFCPVILRSATAYGISERMRFDLTISEFTRELALGNELLIYDENTWRPYCHVSDISDAIIKVLETPEEIINGKVYNVGSNEENYTKKMIVEKILKYIPNGKVNYKEGGFDPRNYRVSFDKISNELNFQPEYRIDNSIFNLINALKNGSYSDYEERKNFYGNYEIKIFN